MPPSRYQRFRAFAKQLVDDSGSDLGRRFNYAIYVLIIVSLVAFSIETIPDISPLVANVLVVTEAVVVVFTLEYACRLIATDHRWRFVFSFYGIIDLIAILPFYLALGVDLRSARTFRLLRLFKVLKVLRFNQASQRLIDSFLMVREEIILFALLTCILLWLSAIGIYYFEHDAQPDKFQSVFHALWWAVATLTTVGYGDVYPVTFGGRMFTFVILIVGLGFIAVPSGLLASAMTQVRRSEAASSAVDDSGNGRG